MKYKLLYMVLAVAMLPVLSSTAQNTGKEQFVVKATGDIGIGNALTTDYAIDGVSSKTSAHGYSVDFGWIFWQQNRHSLEANIGVGCSHIALTADCAKLDFNYFAPATADMDNETYIRYCQVSNLHQKLKTVRFVMPVYVSYRFKISKVFSVHALLGYKFGFNATSKIAESSGNVFSYGVYPQYDDLMIDASYMNEFGETVVGPGDTAKPKANKPTASLLTGVGAEATIWGPLSLGATLKYEWGMNDTFKPEIAKGTSFDANTAPVTYTVAEGQKVTPLTNYLSAKNSRLSVAISLICRF